MGLGLSRSLYLLEQGRLVRTRVRSHQPVLRAGDRLASGPRDVVGVGGQPAGMVRRDEEVVEALLRQVRDATRGMARCVVRNEHAVVQGPPVRVRVTGQGLDARLPVDKGLEVVDDLEVLALQAVEVLLDLELDDTERVVLSPVTATHETGRRRRSARACGRACRRRVGGLVGDRVGTGAGRVGAGRVAAHRSRPSRLAM